ncbi:MAG TPA: DUF3631 domain-containing protein [Candidatus Angelobacter sp.]
MDNKKPTNARTNTPPGAEILDAIASFIRQYLVCDDHQLTILTLWSASTYCPQIFCTAAYLDVRSPEACSGKSVCLHLLEYISHTSGFFTGAPAANLIQRFLPGRSLDDPGMQAEPQPLFTLLLDDCHHSFGRSELQPIVALLNSGSESDGFYPSGDEDYFFFGPKAFAGNTPLPRSLAARCIPIVLRRPKPAEKFARLEFSGVEDAAQPLVNRLTQWIKNARPALIQAAKNDPPNLPPTLSRSQQRCAEPLLHIADVARGSWPAKARDALTAVFDLAEASLPLQMLSDVRSIFSLKDNPEYLATSDLLVQLRTMETRPWSDWHSKSGRRLGRLLHPFGIASNTLHREGAEFKGYRAKDFQDAWERYLPSLSAPTPSDELAASANGNGTPYGTKNASVRPSVREISAIGAD